MFAATLVFISHLAWFSGIDFGPFRPLVVNCRVGVIIFFVLSGYILVRPFLYSTISLRSYALRRAARILPAYYLAIVGSSLLLRDPQVLRHPLEYLTLTQNYDPAVAERFLSVSWTLTIEVAFYAVVPLIAAGPSRLSPLRALEATMMGMAASFLGILCMMMFVNAPRVDYLLAPFFLWVFGLGIVLALVERDWPAHLRILERHGLWLGALALAIAIYLGVFASIDIPTAVAAICLVAALRHRSVPSWVALLGSRCSYSFYLWHQQIISVAAGFAAGWLVALISAPAAILVALVSYHMVERPAQRWVARRSRPNSRAHGPLATLDPEAATRAYPRSAVE
jgi:peptidoglycan/LPS O-acetylase OafA/YrhL